MRWQMIAELIRVEYDNVRDPEVPTAGAVALESVVIGLGNSYLCDNGEFPIAAFHTKALGHTDCLDRTALDWRRGHRILEPTPGPSTSDCKSIGPGYACTHHDGRLHLGYGSAVLRAMWDDEHYATNATPEGRLHSVKERATS